MSRPTLDEIGLNTEKKARLRRILHHHGLGNGTAIFLPYDQGLEHGPRDFFPNTDAADPRYIIRLAVEGGFNGIAIQIGLAEKFYWDYAGEVPLILKLNGKTDIPPTRPCHPCMPASLTRYGSARTRSATPSMSVPRPPIATSVSSGRSGRRLMSTACH
jgi:class I fructose-bisphosphate aldolase